ncbi:MAG: hypothetical protein MRZ60_10100 [Blautia sp.]|nr:hypothetical protein [Blautia sp.]
MKRNSRKFLALFLTAAVSITPAAYSYASDQEVTAEEKQTQEQNEKTEGTQIKSNTSVEGSNAEEASVDQDDNTEKNTAEDSKEKEDSADTDSEKDDKEKPDSANETSEAEENNDADEESEADGNNAADEKSEAEGNKEEAAEEAGSADTPMLQSIVVDDAVYEDGDYNIDITSSFRMFRIAKVTATVSGEKITVTLDSANATYDRIYLGSAADAEKSSFIQGTSNGDGYRYVFELPVEKMGQTITFVPGKSADGSWYTTKECFLTVPKVMTKDETEPTPAPTVEPTQAPTPVPTEAPDPTPTEAPSIEPDASVDDAGMKLEKEDGNEFKMFVITDSSAKLYGDQIEVTISTEKQNYDKLYLGSYTDENKENIITGVPNEKGGYTYTFTVPAEKGGQKVNVAICALSSGNWYAKGELTLTIPELTKTPEETPTVTPVPTKTPEETPTVTPVPTEAPTVTPQATPTPVPAQKPEILEDGKYTVNVESSSSMFRVVNCELTSQKGKMTAVVTLSGVGYDYLFAGTAAQAAAAGESSWVKFKENEEGQYTFRIPVSTLDEGISIAAHSVKNDTWYDRTLTFKTEGMVKIDTENPEKPVTPTAAPTPSPTPVPDDKPESESAHESDLSGSTSAVDNSTSLPDGVYTPDRFTWSGGSGRTSISCSKVTISGGKAYATISFSSTSFVYVKAAGNQYTGAGTFTIPVTLNQNNTIIGMTTKMSVPHEITYHIFVYLAGADKKGTDSTDSSNPSSEDSMISTGNLKLDETAPEIIGLNLESEEKLEYAEYFKIFHYENDITLLEIDMVSDTERTAETLEDTEQDSTAASDVSETEEQHAEDGSSEEAATATDTTEELYSGNVVKYLIVPENQEVPAGLDKDTIIVRQPLEKIYSTSEAGRDTLEQLKLQDFIASEGDYTDMEFRDIIQNECDLVILPADVLKSEEGEQILKETARKMSLLNIPMIVDRSEDEENEMAKAEWLKAYGVLFDCSDLAAELISEEK